MAALVTCGDSDVVSGRIHMPLRGAWWADLKLDAQTPPSGKVTIAAQGGLSIAGTIVRSGAYLNSVHVRVYAGSGGAATLVSPASFQSAKASDALNQILAATGDTASSTIASSVLSAQFNFWSIAAETFGRAIDNLCGGIGRALNQTINWRVLSDGTVWIGRENWPQQSLPTTTDVLWVSPVGPRYELGALTPLLTPGVNVPELGNLSGVDHWIEDDRIRTWAWI